MQVRKSTKSFQSDAYDLIFLNSNNGWWETIFSKLKVHYFGFCNDEHLEVGGLHQIGQSNFIC